MQNFASTGLKLYKHGSSNYLILIFMHFVIHLVLLQCCVSRLLRVPDIELEIAPRK